MWDLLAEILLLISTAFVLGTLAQRFKQIPILGYLMAGTIIGPLLFNSRAVFDVAELGVTLLLFSIGLEFSFREFRTVKFHKRLPEAAEDRDVRVHNRCDWFRNDPRSSAPAVYRSAVPRGLASP